MRNTNEDPPAKKVSKDEIIAAINQITEKRGVPVVQTSDISELESINVDNQTINNHLDELKQMGRVNLFEYGQKGVWWTPDKENSGDVEIGVINWDRIDANEIPHEVLAELPEFQDQTYWQDTKETWGTVSGGAFFLMFATLILEIIRQNTSVQILSGSREILAVIILGTLSVGILSLALVFVMRFMQLLEEKGIFNHIRQRWYNIRNQMIQEIRQRLPDSDESTD